MSGRTLVCVADTDGTIRQLNENWAPMTGHESGHCIGRLVWECLSAQPQVATIHANFLRAAAGELVEDHRGELDAHDGAPLAVRWGYTGLRDSQGAVRSVVVTGTDVRTTSRIQAELAEALDRQQAILDTTVDGILTIGEDGLVQSFNRAAERIFGYRAGEVIGRNVSMLMPQPYRGEHDGYLENYRTTRRKKIIGIGREVEGLRKDGTVFPLDLAVGEVVVGGARVFTGIIRDITDRKNAELEARRRLDEIAHLTRVHSMGDLAAGLAHEINQPLTAIINTASACARMIGSGEADAELLRESMEQIKKQGERAAEVIRRLRKYIEKGEIELQPSDLGASIGEALELLKHEIKVNRVKIAVKGIEGLPQLPLDRVQIEQVFVNLLRNAIEAMVEAQADPPELELAATMVNVPAGIRLSLRDNGPGFGDGDPDQLFAPFFTTKKQGLGQGLSICRRIVDAHGGRIWAEAGQPRGAVFSLWLPLPGQGRNGSNQTAGAA